MGKVDIDLVKYHVSDWQNIDLSKFKTEADIFRRGERSTLSKCDRMFGSLTRDILEFQELLIADKSKAQLIAIQGMDAAGKDHMCREIMKRIDPTLVDYTTFKRPTAQEFAESFLDRHTRALPELGHLGMWNRTHYEEVGTVRVHPELLTHRGISADKATPEFWEGRLGEIRGWEEKNHSQNRGIVKIYLLISPEEQADRLADRAELVEKRRKFNRSDLLERKFWDQHLEAASKYISATSTDNSPWYVVPADDKIKARVIVAAIIKHHLEAMHLQYPNLSLEQTSEFRRIAHELREEAKRSHHPQNYK